MARKLIDISVPLQNDVPADPPGNHPTIHYIDHQQGLPHMLRFFDGLKAEDRPARRFAAVRSEEHTSEFQSLRHLVCRLLLEKKKAGTGRTDGAYGGRGGDLYVSRRGGRANLPALLWKLQDSTGPLDADLTGQKY